MRGRGRTKGKGILAKTYSRTLAGGAVPDCGCKPAKTEKNLQDEERKAASFLTRSKKGKGRDTAVGL